MEDTKIRIGFIMAMLGKLNNQKGNCHWHSQLIAEMTYKHCEFNPIDSVDSVT